MVEIFKSPINIARGSDVSEDLVSDEITIEANSSVRVTLSFANTYASVPIVMYAIQCADDNFSLSHYIATTGTKDVVICVENQALVSRNIVITCNIRARK